MHKLIVCLSCEAEFKLKHDMDELHYMVKFCPFCGEDIEDENYDFTDMEEEENED